METLPTIKEGSFGSHNVLGSLIISYFREEVMGQSPLTVKAKYQDLAKFQIWWLATFGKSYPNHPQLQWTVRDSKMFLQELQRQEYSPATLNRVLASLKSFGTWLCFEKKILSSHPCKGIREFQLAPCEPRAITEIENHRLQKTADYLAAHPKTKYSQGPRDRAIYSCLCSSALRVQEVLNLKLHQFQNKKLVAVICKGGKVFDVRIKAESADLIREYLDHHRVPGSDYLFSNRYGQKLSRNGLGKAFHKLAAFASAPLPESEAIYLHPHKIRHFVGKKVRKKWGDVACAKFLRHATLNHVNRYATDTEIEEEKLLEDL